MNADRPKCNYLQGVYCDPDKVANGDLSGCYLCSHLDFQSRQGGSKIVNDDQSGLGPHWGSEEWDGFGERMKQESQKGCSTPDGVEQTVTQITKGKKSRNELH